MYTLFRNDILFLSATVILGVHSPSFTPFLLLEKAGEYAWF